MKKNLQISLEDAKELLKTNPYLKGSLEELFPELRSKVRDSWQDLRLIHGFFISTCSEILATNTPQITSEEDKNIFATHSQALSSLAYSQLTQLMKDTGDCNDIDWRDTTKKFTIYRVEDEIVAETNWSNFQPIAFKTESIRDEFFEKHQELLKQYFQIQ